MMRMRFLWGNYFEARPGVMQYMQDQRINNPRLKRVVAFLAGFHQPEICGCV